MTSAIDLFTTGLKNAHAMESQAKEMLERQSERLTDYPDLRNRAREHLAETEEQLRRLEQCLARLDSSPSTMKDMALSFGANIAAMGHAMAGDEVLKNIFASAALEQYEIAAYRSLLAMADQAGATEAKAHLELSLREEEQMAAWLNDRVETVTQQYLQHEQQQAA